MQTIEIFILGKYEYKTNIGNWIYYLNYKDAVIKRCGYINQASSPNRTLLVALKMALQQVNVPCNILIHSRAQLGFKNPKHSANKDLIIEIQNMINMMGHVVVFDTADDFGRVNIWEQVYGRGNVVKTPQNNKPNRFAGITNPNDVFKRSEENNKKLEAELKRQQAEIDRNIQEQALQSRDWREMYDDLMSDSHGAWVPGSGGY